MRLSIAFLFLIGAMVANQVMCVDDTATRAAEVRNWFAKTLDRLQNGQTLKQNQEFVIVAIYKANQLLASLALDLVLSSPHGHDLGPINPIMSDRNIIDRIEAVQNKLVVYSNDLPTLHVDKVLEAIKQVHHGDFKSARDAINQSEELLPYNIPPTEGVGYTGLYVDKGRDGFYAVQDPDIPINSFEGTKTETGTIRQWIKLTMTDLYRGRVRIEAFMECLSEIAQVFVNSLPDVYYPANKSKFIGRPVLENPAVIAERIVEIVTIINTCSEGIEIPVTVGIKKDVLMAIRLMFRGQFDEARKTIANSINNRPCSVTPDGVRSFGGWIDHTYGLRDFKAIRINQQINHVEASSSGNNW